ncbi:hypothetical protein ACVIQY_005275 [Bradyrhizobium sp. USDA 3051]
MRYARQQSGVYVSMSGIRQLCASLPCFFQHAGNLRGRPSGDANHEDSSHQRMRRLAFAVCALHRCRPRKGGSRRSSFRNDKAAFFSWLGVTVYLTREANLSTLRAVATCGSPGSEIVFTYVDKLEFSPDRSQSPHNDNAPLVAAIGEPYRSGFDPKEIANDLMSVGLELVEDLDGKKMWERYAGASAAIRQPPASLHIVLARVGSSSA